MATSQRSRSRRTGRERRTAAVIVPQLDPSWQSPYEPSSHERDAHLHAVRRFAWRRRLPMTIAVGVVVVAALVGAALISPWLVVLAVVAGALYGWDLSRYSDRLSRQAGDLAGVLRSEFPVVGSTPERQRLGVVVERLSATFGVDGVAPYVIDDAGYNATLVPEGDGWALLVTSAMIRDYELIELEGVVAHCLARVRVGVAVRQAVAAMLNLDEVARRELSAPGSVYRTDEVAAATIRYPSGLASALRRCAAQGPVAGSMSQRPSFAARRAIWLNPWADRRESDLGDLDDPTVRAMALEEW